MENFIENIVSYWKNVQILYQNTGMFIIYGEYNHLNKEAPKRRLGICWNDYPKIRGKLSPLVIQKEMGKILLSGLMNKAILEYTEDNKELIKKINECMEFIKENND